MYKNLKAALHESNITNAMLAMFLGVAEKTVSNKLRGDTDWTLPEANKIKALLPKYNSSWLFATTTEE